MDLKSHANYFLTLAEVLLANSLGAEHSIAGMDSNGNVSGLTNTQRMAKVNELLNECKILCDIFDDYMTKRNQKELMIAFGNEGDEGTLGYENSATPEHNEDAESF